MKKLLFMLIFLMPMLVYAQTGSLKGKQIGVIGDSYVRNHTGKIEDTWHYKFAQKHQMQYFNYGDEFISNVAEQHISRMATFMKTHDPQNYELLLSDICRILDSPQNGTLAQ